MTEKKSNVRRKNHIVLRRSGHCLYLCIRRKVFKAGNIRLIVEDRINLFLPWRSQRVLKIAGQRFLYSMVPLMKSSHRLLCYNYCAEAMAAHEPDFYQHALVLGCGGGALPRWLLEAYPSLKLDVVDLSPEIIAVCRAYFLQKWEGSERLHYYCMDAKDFEQKVYSYQFIFCDLFDGTDLAPPVFEKNFAEKLYALLDEEGILIINCGYSHQKEVRQIYQEVFKGQNPCDKNSDKTQVTLIKKKQEEQKND